jgi:hypothetical protein
MTVYELVERLGGEIVRGRARWYNGTEHVLLGTLNGDEMTYTEAGRQLAASFDEDKPVVRRKRKADPDELVTLTPDDLTSFG